MRKQRNGEITFDPSVTNKTQLSEGLRIFTKPDRIIPIPAYRLRTPRRDHEQETSQLTIYTDGSCSNNGKQNAVCGSGIWVGDNHHLNKAIKVPGTSHSNQIGELSAVLVALQSADILTPLKIITDSRYVIDGLTSHLTNWEDIGWIGIANATLFKAVAYHLRRCPAPTTFQWTKGHDGQLGNERADKLASEGAHHTEPDNIDTYVPRNFDIQGAKLTKISQKLAYMEIMSRTNLTHKRTTLALLDITRLTVEALLSNQETNETIWHSCRNTDISKNIQLFLYKALHNAHRVGEFWKTIPDHEHRALCTQCPGEIESISHILTDCNNLVNKTIW
jgi:ribonuclease HI